MPGDFEKFCGKGQNKKWKVRWYFYRSWLVYKTEFLIPMLLLLLSLAIGYFFLALLDSKLSPVLHYFFALRVFCYVLQHFPM